MFSPDTFVEYVNSLVDAYPPKNIAFAIDNFDDLLDGKFYTALSPSKYNFRLIEPLFDDFQGEDSGLIANAITGFYLSKQITTLTSQSVKDVREETFLLSKKIIARLIYDSRNEHPFFANRLNRFEDAKLKKDKQTFVSGEGYQIGYLITFQLKFDYIESVDELVTDTNWLDL